MIKIPDKLGRILHLNPLYHLWPNDVWCTNVGEVIWIHWTIPIWIQSIINWTSPWNVLTYATFCRTYGHQFDVVWWMCVKQPGPTGLGNVDFLRKISKGTSNNNPQRIKRVQILLTSGWWFGTFFIFPYIRNKNTNWKTHIFQRGWFLYPSLISKCGWFLGSTVRSISALWPFQAIAQAPVAAAAPPPALDQPRDGDGWHDMRHIVICFFWYYILW